MTTSYPNFRSSSPPNFWVAKYGDVRGFLKEIAHRGEGVLPPLDSDHFVERFPTLEALFAATRAEITDALGVTPEAAAEYCVLIQRLMLWENPDEVLLVAGRLFDQVIKNLPRSLKDIEEGGGGRDLLDPFIMAFASRMLGSSSSLELLKLLVAHKCLMKLEDLIGHLHEEVLGRVAGCERVPEPQGVRDAAGKLNKEVWHPTLNPYPGADARRGEAEFYQIKSKTGSAKGSDGEKLGRQFRQLAERYPSSRRFYISLVGRTLSGHRSMGAFLRTDPEAEVLVGLTAFQQLGRHRDTPDIVLELYLEAFEAALGRNHYDFDTVVTAITSEWLNKHGGEDPALAILHDTITPSNPRHQSSVTYGRPID